MSLPTYDKTMYPMLDYIKDWKKYSVSEISNTIRDKYFNLTDEEKLIKASNGKTKFHDRLTRGRTYLKKAKLVTDPQRWMVQITSEWIKLLNSWITEINIKLLYNYPWFKDFREGNNNKNNETILNKETLDDVSPTDLIDLWFDRINIWLKEDIKEKLKTVNPYYFEKIILELLNKMGYWDFIETSKSWDWGIDWIINQDELWVDKIYIQCKRFNSNKVREPDIRNFIWAMSSNVTKWIFVTTYDFDEKAIEKAKMAPHRIILINWNKLINLMIKFNIWVQNKTKYIVKEIDNEYYIDE